MATATRHAHDSLNSRRPFDEAAAVAELVEIATQHRRGVGPRLRVDLLSHAAGILLGAARHQPTIAWSHPEAARLLLAAGADPDLAEQCAQETLARLALSSGLGGVGNPH
ncbi:hypothetical protein JCM18899A_19030 [Nocardioides sp. AN3]